MRNRFWFAICCLPIAIAVVAASLTAWITPTREQRAMANLVKAGAHVALIEESKGTKSLVIDMSYCTNNDELLDYVSEIENVQGLHLAPAPINEAGLKCLLRLKGLQWLSAMSAHLSKEELKQLKADLKRNNPNLQMNCRESVPLNFDK